MARKSSGIFAAAARGLRRACRTLAFLDARGPRLVGEDVLVPPRLGLPQELVIHLRPALHFSLPPQHVRRRRDYSKLESNLKILFSLRAGDRPQRVDLTSSPRSRGMTAILRAADGRSRRIADVADCGLGRLNWAGKRTYRGRQGRREVRPQPPFKPAAGTGSGEVEADFEYLYVPALSRSARSLSCTLLSEFSEDLLVSHISL